MLYRCVICGDRCLGSDISVCDDCKKAKLRAKLIENASGMPVDILYIKKLLKQDRCVYCGRIVTDKEIEHKTPLSRGGTNDNSNLCLSCAACNHDKGDMTAEEYYEWKQLDNRLPELGVRQKILELLSEYPLTQTVTTVNSKVKKEHYDPPIIKNITVRSDDGHIVGCKKIEISTKILSIKKVTTKEKLTNFGEIYNTVCRLANKKIIRCKTETTTSEELISQY